MLEKWYGTIVLIYPFKFSNLATAFWAMASGLSPAINLNLSTSAAIFEERSRNVPFNGGNNPCPIIAFTTISDS